MVKCTAEKCDYFNEHGECSSACINNGYKKVLTNYDRIKNMTVEELAQYIFDLGNGSEYCYGHCAFQDDDPCPRGRGCMVGVIKWLESEAEDDGEK